MWQRFWAAKDINIARNGYWAASILGFLNDLVKPRLGGKSDQHNMLLYSRLSVAAVSIIAVLLALYIPTLVTLWVTGSAMLVSGLLAPVLFGLFWKKTTKAAGVSGMWLGLSVAVIWQIAGHPFGAHPVFIGFPLSIITVIAVALFSRREKENAMYEEFRKTV
ncbi:hypothetical protein [Halobacillus hunanensis]|uniref:hypothetical protein n=1 Tax=Halobacillus hunanensis TaxID=578214 RepID=UPI0009A74A0B|nr:hypothetical protein [Halobacillus hunanensis]